VGLRAICDHGDHYYVANGNDKPPVIDIASFPLFQMGSLKQVSEKLQF
jgi:hypothetical protein